VRRAAAVACVLFAAGVACSSDGTPEASPSPAIEQVELWPSPDDPMALARKAGLEPGQSESLKYHVHAHLDVFKDGRPVIVPGGIGIDIADPQVKKFDDDPRGPAYGGIQKQCKKPCISPLHTHSPDGVLHTESPTPTPNRLGQFLVEWDVKLPKGTKTYVDGKEYTGDVTKIELSDRKEIAVVMGTPPGVIPSTFPNVDV
jgi:hypothetical protein